MGTRYEIIAGVVFAEGYFEKVVVKPSWEELYSYGEGLTDGANLYGAGACGLYTLEVVEDEMKEDDPIRMIVVQKIDALCE